MAVELNQVINEVSIIDKTKEGAASAVESMDKVAKGADKMGASTTKSASGFDVLTKAQASAASGLNRLKAEADPAEAAIQRLARAEQMLDRAMRQGLTTEAEKIRVLDQLKVKYNEAAMAGGRMGVATSNLSGALRRNAQAIAVLQGPLGAVSGRFSALGSLIGAVNPLVAAGAVGFAALSATIGKSVGVAEEFERASLKTQAILKATGSASGQTADGIRKLSHEIAAMTLASTRGVEAAAQKLLTFRSVSGDVFRRTLELSQDLAEVGFGTIESGAVQLGKALEDPEKGLSALTRVGVSFSAQMKEQISLLTEQGRTLEAQTLILNAVEEQVGGAGRAAAGGLSGAYDTLSQRVEDFLVNVGNTGPLDAAVSAVNALADAIGRVNKALFPDTQTEIEKISERLSKMNSGSGAMAPGGMGTGIVNIERQRAELQSRLADLLEMQRLDRTLAERARQSASRVQADSAAANDNERAKSVEDFIKALNTEIEVLRLSDIERGKRNAADKAEKEARKEIAGITEEQIKAVRQAAIAAEVEAQAIKKATDARKADEQATKALSDRRAETIDGLKSEQEYLKRLLDAQRLGKDEVWEVEAARKAELVAIQLKIASGTEERTEIEGIVKANESLRKSIKSVADEQAEAEKAAERAAKEQKKAIEDAQREYEKLIDSIANTTQDRLGDALFDHLRGETIDFAEFLKTTILRAVADLAAAIAMQKIVMPIIVQAVGAAPGLFGLTGQAAGIASGQGGLGGFNPLSLLTQGQGGGLFNQFAMSGLGQSLGLSYGAGTLATNAGVFAAGSGALGTFAAGGPAALALTGPAGGMGAISGLATASTGGAVGAATAGGALGASGGLTGLGAGLMAAAPFLAIAAMALPLLMGGLGRKPSVGPTSVGRVTDLLDPSSTVLSFDNGGAEGDAVMRVVDAVSKGVREGLDRYTGELRAGSGFDFGFFSAPEDGNRSGQSAGWNVKAIIDGLLEDADRFRGLSEEQAVANATMIALREMVDFQSATLTAIQTTGREDAAGFLEDLEFGREFDLLRSAIDDLGGSIDASTLAMADLRAELVRQGQEQATTFFSGLDAWLSTAMRLFDGAAFVRTTGGAGSMAQEIIDGLRANPPSFDEGSFQGSGGAAGAVTVRRGDPMFADGLGTILADGKEFATRINEEIGRGVIELLSPDGDVLGQYSQMNELLGDLGNALERFGDMAAAAAPALEKTTEYFEQLARTRDSLDIAAARVDQFFGELTGALQPAVIGDYESRLLSVNAAIEASRPGLEAINDNIRDANDGFEELGYTLLDVGARIEGALDLARSSLRGLLESSLEARLRSAQGFGAVNAIDNLIAGRARDLSDAAALGADAGLVGQVFAAELRSALSGLGADGLSLALQSTADAAAHAVISTLLAEAESRDVYTGLISAQEERLRLLQDEQRDLSRLADTAGRASRALRAASAGFLTDPNLSPLSGLDRVNEARSQFETALALANDDDPFDVASQDAIGRLPDLSRTLLEASRDYYASSEGYLADFNRVQAALNSTALSMESIESQQLSRLVSIDSQLAAAVTALENLRILSTGQPLPGAGGVGTSTPTGDGGVTNDYGGSLTADERYLFANPDLMAAAQAASGTNNREGMNAWAQWHWETTGQHEAGRPRFNTGGSFTVGGMGGVDNLRMPDVRVSAGEIVNISRKDNMAEMVSELQALRQEVVDLRRVAAITGSGTVKAVERGNEQRGQQLGMIERAGAAPKPRKMVA
jgi:hypothetical protein